MGFMAIDGVAECLKININKEKFDANLGEGEYKGEKVILLKPQTYMNLSGESVTKIVNFYKISLQDLIVIYDDVDLPLGYIRIKKHGSPGSHNGIKNITELLGDEGFSRIRIGIDKPGENIDLKDFVLTKFTKEEKQIIDRTINVVRSAVLEILENGLDSAMNLYNNKNEV